jgi:hypothetical protein
VNTFSFTYNIWTNIQATWDGTTLKAYINGTLYSSIVPGVAAIDNTGSSYVIGRQGNNLRYIVGEIGEVRIYNYALTQAQVTTDFDSSKNLYSNYTTGPRVFLLGYSYAGSGAWLDNSGSGRNAALAAGAISKSDNGVVFNGSTYWTFGNVAVGNSFTFSMWYKQTGNQSGAGACIISQQGGKAAGLNLNFNIGDARYFTDNQIQGGFYTNGNNYYPDSFSLQYNVWNNIVVTWNGTTLIEYLNNTLHSQVNPGVAAYDNGTVYNIGKGWNVPGYIVGQVGEVRVYNYALNSTQIDADFRATEGNYAVYAISNFALTANQTDTGIAPKTAVKYGTGTLTYGTVAGKACLTATSGTGLYFPHSRSTQNTYSIWFRKATSNGAGVYDCFFALSTNIGGAVGTESFRFMTGPNATVYLDVFWSNSGTIYPFFFTYTPGSWYHIALSIDYWWGTCKGYVNGVFQGVVTGSGSMTSASYAIIGKSGNNGLNFTGSVRGLQIHATVLSAAQILAIYNAG